MRAVPVTLTVIRLLLGVVFVAYGLVKLLGGQFIHDDFVIDSRTTDGPTLVWSFYGYSELYGKFIGLCEVAAGALLLVRQTRILGALVLFPICVNVTVMDFCFDFPAVKYLSLLSTLLCGVLLAAELPRLRPVLWAPAPADDWRAPAWVRYPGIALGLVAAALVANVVAAAVRPGPEAAARERCVAAGWPDEGLRRLRWTVRDWSGINGQGHVEFEAVKGGTARTLRVAVWRPHGFADWQVTGYEELPAATGAAPRAGR